MHGTTTEKNHFVGTCKPGTQLPFEAISTPGCYVCNWSGHLLRVPQDGVAAGRPTALNITGHDALFVTMLSENAFVPVTKARMLAADYDLACCF